MPRRLSQDRLIEPVAEVAEILPREERIILHRSPRPTATERLQDWRERVQLGALRGGANSEVEGVAAGTKRIEAQREVEAVIERLTHRIGLRLGRGGEREMTPDVEASTEPSAEEPSAEEPSAEEPSAEEQAGEKPAAEETPAETAAEAVLAEEPAAEEPPVEEQSGEEQTTT